MNPSEEKIGVIGFAGPERTRRDIALQAEFNRLTEKGCRPRGCNYPVSTDFMEPIPSSMETFRYRTERDKCAQAQFNPWFNENREDFR